MSYATYEYYRGQFDGNLIPDAETFNSHTTEADAYLDHITRGQIKITDETTEAELAAISNAACAVAEVLYKQAQDESATVTSESVGNHSIGYSNTAKTTADREGEKYRKAALFLSRTGLLYRGLR